MYPKEFVRNNDFASRVYSSETAKIRLRGRHKITVTTSTRPTSLVDDSFQAAIWPGMLAITFYKCLKIHVFATIFAVLAVGQIFGLMPLQGIRCVDVVAAELDDEVDNETALPSSKLKFRWCLFRTWWSMLYLTVGVTLSYCSIEFMFKKGITPYRLGALPYHNH